MRKRARVSVRVRERVGERAARQVEQKQTKLCFAKGQTAKTLCEKRKAQSKQRDEEGEVKTAQSRKKTRKTNNNKQSSKCHLSMAKEFGIQCGKLQNVVERENSSKKN